MSKKNNPRFFCDSCGKAVPYNSSSCPHCGSSFSGVRCPSCGYQGFEDEFSSGCPSCGFLATDALPAGGRSAERPGTIKKETRLPIWFYRIALVILLMLLGGLVFIFGTRVV